MNNYQHICDHFQVSYLSQIPNHMVQKMLSDLVGIAHIDGTIQSEDVEKLLYKK